MNIQFAVKKEDGRQVLYVLEVNPRASRTVPFVCQGHGHAGGQDRGQGDGRASRWPSRACDSEPVPSHVSVKESVFPFRKFAGRRHRAGARDAIDRRSDGDQRAVFDRLCQEPVGGRHRAAARAATIFISVAEPAKDHMVGLAQRLAAHGLPADGHRGHRPAAGDGRHRGAARQEAAGGAAQPARLPGRRRHSTDHEHAQRQGRPHRRGPIRAAAVAHGVPCITTIQAADAAVRAMEALRDEEISVQALQDRLESLVVRK